MTSDRWSRLSELVDGALAQPAAQRERWLGDAAQDEPEILAQVLTILRSGDQDSQYFGGLVDSARGSLECEGELQPGERIGAYSIVREIGKGGMGVVYEGVRSDEEFTQSVAIKLIARGMESPQMLRRFRSERKILAGLNHPNIARIFDGGSTSDGRPYFVMELVAGRPLLQYCREENLSNPARLALFVTVCSAVQHAHERMIVHRDIKPGNILVSSDGIPKLLDFGIAKAMDSTQDNQLAVTMTAAVLMTPEYASPEQVRGETVTAATDVYALGAVLFELLTGERVHRFKDKSPAEVARVICEQAPPTPGLGQDLDYILLMALRKEPERRYNSVRQFAEDIERWLQHRPVVARGDSISYRASKFLRRHRISVAASLLLIGGLTAALLVTLRAERKAQSRFDDVRQLATTFLVEFDSDIRQLPGSTSVRVRLMTTALQYLDRLALESSRDLRLTQDLVRSYAALADVQGMPGLQSLGQAGRAEESYRKSCRLADQLLRMDPLPTSSNRTRAAFSYSRLGYLLFVTGRLSEGRPFMLKAAELIAPRVTFSGADGNDFRTAANTYTYLSQLERQAGHARASAAYSAKSLEYMTRYQALTPGFRASANLARAVGVAARSANSRDLLQAAQLWDRAVGIGRELLRQDPGFVAVRRELAVTLEFRSDTLGQQGGPSLGRLDEALASIEESVALFRSLVKQDPQDASAKQDLAQTIVHMALIQVALRSREAETHLAEAIALMGSLPDGVRGRLRDTGLCYMALAEAQAAQFRYTEALKALDRASALFYQEEARQAKPGDEFLQQDWRAFWGVAARIHLRQQQFPQALDLLQKRWQSLSPAESAAAEDIASAFPLAQTAADLAEAYSGLGDNAKSAEWFAHSTRIWQPWAGKYPSTDRRLYSSR